MVSDSHTKTLRIMAAVTVLFVWAFFFANQFLHASTMNTMNSSHSAHTSHTPTCCSDEGAAVIAQADMNCALFCFMQQTQQRHMVFESAIVSESTVQAFFLLFSIIFVYWFFAKKLHAPPPSQRTFHDYFQRVHSFFASIFLQQQFKGFYIAPRSYS